jgi:hypothetical protein
MGLETRPAILTAVAAYREALRIEAALSGDDAPTYVGPSPGYQDAMRAAGAAEDALLASKPLNLADLNAKAQAFLTPQGKLANDVGVGHMLAVAEALARDIRQLADAGAPPLGRAAL